MLKLLDRRCMERRARLLRRPTLGSRPVRAIGNYLTFAKLPAQRRLQASDQQRVAIAGYLRAEARVRAGEGAFVGGELAVSPGSWVPLVAAETRPLMAHGPGTLAKRRPANRRRRALEISGGS